MLSPIPIQELTMKPIITSVEIDRPINDVFEYLSNLDNAPQWTTGLIEIRHDGDLRTGATGTDVRTMGRKQVEMPWTVTAFAPPCKMVFEYGPPFPVTAVFSLETMPAGGTRLTCRTQMRLLGLYRLLAPIVSREARKVDKVQFARAKDILESSMTQPQDQGRRAT
jgi:uncharacterized protein YndB with AHSA1/START domain